MHTVARCNAGATIFGTGLAHSPRRSCRPDSHLRTEPDVMWRSIKQRSPRYVNCQPRRPRCLWRQRVWRAAPAPCIPKLRLSFADPKMSPLAGGSCITNAKVNSTSMCWLFTGAVAVNEFTITDVSVNAELTWATCRHAKTRTMHQAAISITACATAVYEVPALLFDDQCHLHHRSC